MTPEIRARMASQRGLITRPQALADGLTAREISQLVRRGAWVAVRRGVYADTGLVDSLTTRSERQRLADDAAVLRMGVDHVRSHDSAALVLGLPILIPQKPYTHVTRSTVHGARHEFGVKHHVAPFADSDVVDVAGVRCLRPARTAVDIAREHGHPYGLVALDSYLRMGGRRAQVDKVIETMKSWPRITVVRREWALADAGSESVGETLARALVTELGFGRPQTQFGLSDGTRTIWVDLRVGRHLFEFDGLLKYRAPDAGGVAAGPAQDILFEEKRRQDFATGFKLGMSRIVWTDVWGRGREEAKRRLTREYLDTCRRFGTAIDDLAPFIVSPRRPAA